MLVRLKDMLLEAERGGYAIVAPNFPNIPVVMAFIRCAEEANAPLLLSFSAGFRNVADIPDYSRFIQIVRREAELSRAPLGLHLDHGNFEDVIEALDYGFTSVMIDASQEPFELNVRKTQQIVELAHSADVDVEAELGHVAMGNEYLDRSGGVDKVSVFTDPREATQFVTSTGIDALAVSIGTVHGLYRYKACLDFARLQKLYESVPVPLVLHGSSGTGEENIRTAIAKGVRKINVYSDIMMNIRRVMQASYANPLHGVIDWHRAQYGAISEVVNYYLEISGSIRTG